MLYVELGAIFQVQSFMFHYSSKVIIEEITLFFQIKAFDGKTATICLFLANLKHFLMMLLHANLNASIPTLAGKCIFEN